MHLALLTAGALPWGLPGHVSNTAALTCCRLCAGAKRASDVSTPDTWSTLKCCRCSRTASSSRPGTSSSSAFDLCAVSDMSSFVVLQIDARNLYRKAFLWRWGFVRPVFGGRTTVDLELPRCERR